MMLLKARFYLQYGINLNINRVTFLAPILNQPGIVRGGRVPFRVSFLGGDDAIKCAGGIIMEAHDAIKWPQCIIIPCYCIIKSSLVIILLAPGIIMPSPVIIKSSRDIIKRSATAIKSSRGAIMSSQGIIMESE
ncbi:MAG: hypothetical protein JXB49_26380, partial [Bacteroidales bacterium]|nr:hypothetical protein [Bacteroidales bacterium]